MNPVISTKCRTCLTQDRKMISIFEGKTSMATMVMKISCVRISTSDGLPDKICVDCASQVKKAYSFSLKCENSDLTLKQILKVHLNKSEPNIIVDDDDSVDIDSKDNVFNKEQVDLYKSDGDDSVYDVFIKRENLPILEIPDEKTIENDNKIDIKLNDSNSSMKIVPEEVLSEFGETSFEESQSDNNSDNANWYSSSKCNTKKDKLKKCPYCYFDFKHGKNLEKHIQKYHVNDKNSEETEKGNISDEESNKDDSSDEESENDNVNSDEKSKENSKEIVDDKKGTEIINTIVDMRQKQKILNTPYQCLNCGAGFAREKSLTYHIKSNKCTEEQFACTTCGRVFINKSNLLEHAKSHSIFTCSRCSKSFSSEKELQKHIDKNHKSAKKNQCHHCNKVFTMLSTLRDHMRVHNGEKPFLCNVCGKTFSQGTNLRQHQMRHDQTKPFKCDHCDRSFVSKGELFSHIRTHTGDHPFKCDACNKGFTTSSSLAKHRRSHTGERPYSCEYCPMRFSRLQTLKNHRRTHTGETPFICDYCGKGFTQKSDCNTHMRRHTNSKSRIAARQN